MTKAQRVLRTVFGYETFRPLQEEIIAKVLARQDTLVIMPTGGGKSLCYQIPALLFDGLTVVVSPLISLMKDQVEQLKALGVPVAVLNSSLSPEDYRANVRLVKSGEASLLYLAPETMLMPRTLSLLQGVRLDCLTIDEAHCISEWGHDFRPEYRQLAEVRRRFPKAVCLALTATATPRVRRDIKSNLRFSADHEFIASFDRPNLFLQVVPKSDPVGQTLAFLQELEGQSGIIYCFSRRQVEELAQVLQEEGFSALPYHAGLPEEVRRENQERFIRDDVPIIVATIAFGMGINKPNVRFVLHFDLPKNIESYYQEIGRAGRDGLRAQCLLLFSYSDAAKIRYFFREKSPRERLHAERLLQALVDYAEDDNCRRVRLLAYFGEKRKASGCDMCDNCTAAEEGLVDLTEAAQKFLSCVYRTGQIFGANHVIDVLRGSRSEKVLQRGHGNLSTYGIGQEFSKKQWFHLARQFVRAGLLHKEPEYGSLKITPEGWKVLRGQERFRGRLEEERVRVTATDLSDLDYDRELFEILRQKRKALADRANVPPYVIFPDNTLVQMAAFYPQSEESFLRLHGVGRVKLKKYGTVFLDAVYSYCRRKGLEERLPERRRRTRESRARSRFQKRRYQEVGEMFQAGRSIEAIMKAFSVKRSTVLNHLYNFVRAGYALDRHRLLEASTLPRDRQMAVLGLFEQLGAERLTPIYERCKEEISYDELALLRLVYLSVE